MAQIVGFNVNKSIYVKLSAEGEAIWYEYWKKINEYSIPKIKKDIHGLVEMNFWVFMKIFGGEGKEYLSEGNAILPFDPNIYFNKWDFEFFHTEG